MIERLCHNCGINFIPFNSFQKFCNDCAYEKNYNTRKRLRKRALTAGKRTDEWFKTRELWIKQHPPDHNGRWICYLQIHPWCPKYLTYKTITLDHIKARSRVPKKRLTPSNLRPSCIYCNQLKGSLSIAQIEKKYNVKIRR